MAYFSCSHVNKVTHKIIGAAMEIHRRLGPGLFETTYHTCMLHELALRRAQFRSRAALPLAYKGVALDAAYQLDLIVEDVVIVELKAVQELAPIHDAQVMTYLKLTGAPAGLLINFHVPLLRDGVKRFVNGEHEILDDSDPSQRHKLNRAQISATRLPE